MTRLGSATLTSINGAPARRDYSNCQLSSRQSCRRCGEQSRHSDAGILAIDAHAFICACGTETIVSGGDIDPSDLRREGGEVITRWICGGIHGGAEEHI